MAKELTELELLEIEQRKAALEAQRIDTELKMLQLGKLRQEVETAKNNKERGKADAAKAIADEKERMDRCNHHLGGEGALAVAYGQGDMERPTAISGIQFTDQNTLFRCNRCGKKWSQEKPQGDGHRFGPWLEGVRLFSKSQFKQIAVVGGLVVKKPKTIEAQ